MLLAYLHHVAYASVVITVLAGGVVLHKHNLRALFQHQCLSRGIGIVGECALHLGMIQVGMSRKLLQFRLVVEIRQIVVCGETDGIGGVGGKS